MGCFIPELTLRVDGGCRQGAYCNSRGSCNECPDTCVRYLSQAACQGAASARLLTREACRLLETASNAGGAELFPDIDGALERTLTQALCSEMSIINEMCVRSAKRVP